MVEKIRSKALIRLLSRRDSGRCFHFPSRRDGSMEIACYASAKGSATMPCAQVPPGAKEYRAGYVSGSGLARIQSSQRAIFPAGLVVPNYLGREGQSESIKLRTAIPTGLIFKNPPPPISIPDLVPTPPISLPDLVKNCVVGIKFLMSRDKLPYAEAAASVKTQFVKYYPEEDWPKVEEAAKSAGLDKTLSSG
jgi:hypothetical protein